MIAGSNTPPLYYSFFCEETVCKLKLLNSFRLEIYLFGLDVFYMLLLFCSPTCTSIWQAQIQATQRYTICCMRTTFCDSNLSYWVPYSLKIHPRLPYFPMVLRRHDLYSRCYNIHVENTWKIQARLFWYFCTYHALIYLGMFTPAVSL